MRVLIEGAWRDEELPPGGWSRRATAVRDRITADGSSDSYD